MTKRRRRKEPAALCNAAPRLPPPATPAPCRTSGTTAPHIPPRRPCRSRRCFPCFFDGFRAFFQARWPPRPMGSARTGTLPFCVCISMGGRTCPKWAVFARFRFYGRCRIALAPVNRAAWRRSRATAPPGASHRIAHGDEAPQARGTMGMRATIVFAPCRGATYCVHYIYARMQGLKIICQRGWRYAINMPKGMALCHQYAQ